jgi:RCC1 and BTB domain-containing protein 1|nr:MAG TPA: alpha-tubulin suppressor [Caudoviricetes sp.]
MQTSKYEIGANLQGLEFRRQANEILAALASSNAGNLEPASAQAGTVWLDTSNDKKHLLKIRNKANNAWGTLCSIDAQSGAVDAIDAYSKIEADGKFLDKTTAKEFAQKNELPTTASKTTLGLVKLTDDVNSMEEGVALAPSALQEFTKRQGIRLLPDTKEGIPWHFMLAVTYDEEILFWGRNADMSIVQTLSNAHINGICSIYNPLKGKSKVKKIKIFSRSIYVLYENGDLYAMGLNTYGQMGVGNTSWVFSLTKSTDNVKDFWSSSAGYHHEFTTVVALKNDGTVWGVGYNSSVDALGIAQLQNQINWIKLSPAIDPDDEIVFMKPHGGAYGVVLLLTKKGKAYSCGYGAGWGLGLGDTTNKNTFNKIAALDHEKVVKLFISGGYGADASTNVTRMNVLALCENGNAYGWGANAQGELGLGHKNAVPMPTKLALNNTSYNAETNPIVDVICPPCGPSFFCLLLKNGDLYGAGYNAHGYLGDGTTADKTSFIKIASDVKKAYVVSSLWYAYPTLFYVTKNNEMFACGCNGQGQAGVNSSSHQLTPGRVKFSDVEKITHIESCGYNGSTTSLILTSDGKVYGSGYSTYGVATPYQAGIGVTTFTKVM